jgi:secreted trypsin-like serine protease
MNRLVLLAATVAACSAPFDADAPRQATEPIVNGTTSPDAVELTAREVRAVAAIVSSDDEINFCTATVITPTVALTAAHCLVDWGGDPVDADEVLLALGSDAADPEALIEPASVEVHPDYDAYDGDAEHDVALLIFDAPLARVTPLIANCAPLTGLVGDDVQNVGYGETEYDEDNSRRLWAVQEVVSLTTHDFVVDAHGDAGVCFGDSGGPSLQTMSDGVVRIIGTLSWGDAECGARDHFARVDRNCEFIETFADLSQAEPAAADEDGDVPEGCAAGAPGVWGLALAALLFRRRS